MNRLLLKLTLLFLAITFTSCSKTPFAEQNPESDKALVYVYVAEDDSINETYRKPSYKITINGIRSKDSIGIGEYIVFNLKPISLIATATRSDIEIQKLNLELEAGKAYFLRVRSFSDDFGKFKFELVDNKTALNEIKDTTLATEVDKKEEFINSIGQDDDTPKKSSENISKIDEIKKAHMLKKDGIITDEEFNKLKAEILAK